ncbi:hypothetical protein B2J93_1759 [Marssonina coronariae]|uniref:Vacuolar import and degradation protein 21 n=1 Tax=Diplocarpon coronariae TaxID=2795749 RepID=A0A218ZDN1_9HELO|nr:hypothetical protein B2J93_1759 [Marssonina coronariae]
MADLSERRRALGRDGVEVEVLMLVLTRPVQMKVAIHSATKRELCYAPYAHNNGAITTEDEAVRIVTSRKRKLREFWAVCEGDGPLPQTDLSNPDAPPATIAEARFLEVTDILQDRLFDESNLPSRRQLRSDAAKQKHSSRKASSEGYPLGTPRKAENVQRDGFKSRKSRATTPSSRSDAGAVTAATSADGAREPNPNSSTSAVPGIPTQRSTSKSSQTDLPAEASAVLAEIVKETLDQAMEQQPSLPAETGLETARESDRIRTRVESRPNSPGVDPRKTIPISAEDAAHLAGPLVQGLGSHEEPHKAVTAHLPSQEVQEQKLKQTKRARVDGKEHASRLLINAPRDVLRNVDAVSSPGSTIDAHSATTPVLHEASSDTSPENEWRYDAERLDNKEDDVPTPPELKPTAEEISENEHHDRILKAQMEISAAEIMKDRIGEPGSEEQVGQRGVREEQQAGDSQAILGTVTQDDAAKQLTEEARQAVQDIVEDGNDVVGVPTPDEQVTAKHELPELDSKEQAVRQPEVFDSEAEESVTPVADHMDVETTTVNDSFESHAATESLTAISPSVPQPSEQSVDPASSSNRASAAPTPQGTPSIPAVAPPTERMTTRVASGAMRHKSVSEILGETAKVGASSCSDSSRNSRAPSRSTTPRSSSAQVRLAEKAKERERSKLSTVIFPGRGPKAAAPGNSLVNGSPVKPAKDDYFKPLFLATASNDKRGIPSLETLLATAHKTITTSNSYVTIQENQTIKVLKRIYQAQCSNKWTLRQPKRSLEPIRPTSHWDILLQEAKWMRTDFREESKWKMAAARNLASACAEWVECGPEDRRLLQVNATPPKPPGAESSLDIDMGDASSQAGTHPTPDLVASGGFDSPMEDFDEEPRLNLLETVPPTAIFGLQDDDIVFGLRRSPTTDKLLDELPMYGAPLRVPRTDVPTSDTDPDRLWKRPALPLSKFVEGRMELDVQAPPRKKSRFEHELEDDDADQVIYGEQPTRSPNLPAESTIVALFDPQYKHIRDRIHSSHQFRPPSEFAMPLQSFFECRIASQWTWDEDNELKNYVRDYSYNWGLISSLLASKSLYVSGAERRTPWECFERWIHLEGLPADMQKTHYFRAYTARIEAANRNVTAQNNAIPPQPNPNGQVQQVTPRRRPTTSIRVERRRNQKHLTLVDAMRKLAKKRETTASKQLHAAGLAQMRKANEPPPGTRNLLGTTPQDFSRMKHERDEQFRERVLQLQMRQDAARKANTLQAQQQQQQQQQQGRNPANPQQPGLPNGGPPRPANSAVPANANGPAPMSGQNLTVPGQNRPPRPMPPQMPGPPLLNSLRTPQMGMNGVPTAQMQGQMPLPNPSLDHGLVSRAHQISQHQQAILRQQQGGMPAQAPPMHNSPPRMNGMSQTGFAMPTNMMPPFNPNTNGVSTPPANSHMPSPVQGHAGSPRISQNPLQHPTVHAASHVQILEHQIKQRHPNATAEQVRQMIQEQLPKSIMQQQQQQQQRHGLAQSAMNAAAGAGGNTMHGANGVNAGQSNPQLYAQMLRKQQENQLAAQAQQQAASAVGAGQSQAISTGNTNGGGSASGSANGSASGGNSAQGHAHRASSGSVPSGK